MPTTCLESEKLCNSFRKGWLQVALGKSDEVKMRLMQLLGINSRTSWSNRLAGIFALSPAERASIENVFAEYGITDIWGEA